MREEINHDRRRFLTTAMLTIASTELGMIGSAGAQSSKAKPATVSAIKPGTNKSFGPLKQVDAGLLNVGYAEMRPLERAAEAYEHMMSGKARFRAVLTMRTS